MIDPYFHPHPAGEMPRIQEVVVGLSGRARLGPGPCCSASSGTAAPRSGPLSLSASAFVQKLQCEITFFLLCKEYMFTVFFLFKKGKGCTKKKAKITCVIALS